MLAFLNGFDFLGVLAVGFTIVVVVLIRGFSK
jgi:hypothetical protein